jgi:hypothetical protein
MKTFTLFLLVLASAQAFAASKNDARGIRNAKIEKCMKSVNAFFRGVRWNGGMYYEGHNNMGRCFIGYTPFPRSSGMSLFVNSKQSRYIGSIEIRTESERSLGFSNDIKECQVTGSSFALRNVYRMPHTIYYGSDGSVKTSWSIFDVIYHQSVKITKGRDGRLISAQFNTEYGLQTCSFQ